MSALREEGRLFRSHRLMACAIFALALLSVWLVAATDARAACTPTLLNNQVGGFVTCTGTDNAGVGNGSQDQITVTVLGGATIDVSASAGATAIELQDSNAVTNDGKIVAGDSGIGISVHNGNTVINSGSIVVGDSGTAIDTCCDNTIINSGTIRGGNDAYGIYSSDRNTITNSGKITLGDDSYGIVAYDGFISAGSNATIRNTGEITVGADGYGIAAQSNYTVFNSGTINAGAGGIGILADEGVTINNSGTIKVGDSGYGIATNYLGGTTANTIINSGTIEAGDSAAGVAFDGNTTFTNSGTIRAGADGYGVKTNYNGDNTANTLTNTASGQIIALNGIGVQFGGDNNTLTNYGLIRSTGGSSSGAWAIEACFCTNNNKVVNYGTVDGYVYMIKDTTGHVFDNHGTLTITDSDASTVVGDFYHYIEGTYTQFSGGTLELRVTSDTRADNLYADAIDIRSGTTLRARIQPGLYDASTTYTNVVSLTDTSTPGITSTFSNIVSSSPFFTVTPIYNSSDPAAYAWMDLQIDRIAFNAVPNLTDNQKKIADILEPGYSTSLTGDPATFYSNLLAATSTGALDALSGEGTSTTQNAAFGAGGLFNSTMMSQILSWLGGAGGSAGGGPLAFAQADKHEPAAFKSLKKEPATSGWRLWLAGFFGQRFTDGEMQAGSASTKTTTGGGAMGVDRQVAPDLLVGFSVGASASSFSVADRDTTGELTAGHIGIYGTKFWGQAYTAGTLSYARFDNTTRRTIAGIGTTERASGSFSSDLAGARIEIGYRHKTGGYVVTPFAALEAAQLWQRGYTETSFTSAGAPGILGLTYGARSTTSLPLFLGVQADTQQVMNNGTRWMPFVRAAWVHEFMPDRRIDAAFITLPDAAFTVAGARAARDSAKINAGARWYLNPQAYMFALADTELSGRTASYSSTAGFKSSW
jgi:uncharacterized protein with beta-barrel porin domain